MTLIKESLKNLDITPMQEIQQLQIKGGTADSTTDDKRGHRPGAGSTN